MYGKRRTIPLNVSVWMDKDVKVRKATASSGLMPDETRISVFLSRQFYADMLDLSSERHRQMARFDYNRKTFLKKQKHKAETNLPGLLPYIEPFKGELKEESAFTRHDQFHSSSLQSMANPSLIKSDATYPPRKLPARKSPRRPQISLERINQLAQPRGQRIRSPSIDQLRANPIKANHVDQLFYDLDEISYQNSFASKEQTSPTNDRRFQKLIHLFSEVYEPAPATMSSKRFDLHRQQERKTNPILPPIERKDQPDIRNDSYLINACV